MPGLEDSLAVSSSWTGSMVRVRLSQGLLRKPKKPWPGVTSWKLWSNSGTVLTTLWTSLVNVVSCSMVAFGGRSKAPKMKLWTSLGASSAGENMNIGTTHSVSTIQIA